jgi:hypothetical protein
VTRVLSVDFGSTCTKAALVDADDGTLVATGTTATTIRSDVPLPLVSDHPGGWRVPERARPAVDDRYVLFAAGLLRPHAPAAAARFVTSALREVPR